MPKSEEDKLEKQIQMQLLNEELVRANEQLKNLSERVQELNVISDTLDELKNKKGRDSLFPIGAGVFVHGKISDDDKVLLSVGNKIVVRKGLEEAKELIKKEKESIEQIIESMRDDMDTLMEQFNLMQQ